MPTISTEQAAAIAGVTPRRIRQLISDRRIRANRIGRRSWGVSLASVKRYGDSASKTGRPRTSKENLQESRN